MKVPDLKLNIDTSKLDQANKLLTDIEQAIGRLRALGFEVRPIDADIVRLDTTCKGAEYPEVNSL